jgi:hypothetical protein
MKFTALALAALAAGVAQPALAGTFDGTTLHTRYLYPEQGSIYQDFGDITVSGDTLLAAGLGTGGVDLHANGSNLNATFNNGASSWNSASFNGFVVFDDTDSLSAITSVTINSSTTLGGFDSSRVTFDADHIFVNWQGLAFHDGDIVSLAVNSGAVPEPASWAMMLGGFGLVGGAMRSRRKAAATFA